MGAAELQGRVGIECGLFGKVVSTAIKQVAALPVAVFAKDVVTLGGVASGKRQSCTADKIDQIKDEAQ